MILSALFLSALVASIKTEDVNVKEYLTHFGYHNPHAFGNNDLANSLKQFQKAYGLKETGKADSETIALMKTPRCGNKDHNSLGYRDTAWRKKYLTYYFHNYTPDMGQSTIRSETQQALRYWSDVTPLQFTERHNGDIVIAFGSGSHSDNKRRCYSSFDGRGGVLAHAFFPPDGRLHFDESENFVSGRASSQSTNYLWVATHELGHILGLEHDTHTKDAVMYPYYRGGSGYLKLHANDIRRIQALYGRGTGGGNPPPPPTQSPPTGGCYDKDRSCYKYTRYCNDSGWRNWIYQNCKKTCNKCSGTGTGGGNCSDRHTNCYQYKHECGNPSWRSHMQQNCRRTCNMC